MRRAARLDTTHRAIVQALRKVGCQVLDLAGVGNGCPDLAVRVQTVREWTVPGPALNEARILLMEVKAAHGRLTSEQKRFIAEWPETRIVRSIDEALAAVGVKG